MRTRDTESRWDGDDLDAHRKIRAYEEQEDQKVKM